jgi:uncharacterized membrane protein
MSSVEYAKLVAIFLLLTVIFVFVKSYLLAVASRHYQKDKRKSARFWIIFYSALAVILIVLALTGIFTYQDCHITCKP